ncbi:Pr6Pr family membrane protein [Microbacterium phyllosphaerae]
MVPRSRLLARSWFAIVALIGVIGFALQFYLLFTGGADANSGETGATAPLGVRFFRLFSFFTIQSNVFVLIASLLLVFRPRLGPVMRVIYHDAVLSIAVTGLVFSFVLDPTLELRGGAAVVTTLFHNVIPVVFLAGWLLWGPRRLWTWRSTLWAFAWPLAWIIGCFAVGAATGWYPYAFLDPSIAGLGAAVGGAAIVFGLAVVLALITLLIDRKVPAITASGDTRRDDRGEAALTAARR